MSSWQQTIQKWWYQPKGMTPAKLLLPLTPLYRYFQQKDKHQKKLIAKDHSYPVPILVVGNVTVGGTGKTPFCIALVKFLSDQGLRVGVVSRGYGGAVSKSVGNNSEADLSTPQFVDSMSDPELVGDEPVLIAQQCRCAVVVHPDRNRAVHFLLSRTAPLEGESERSIDLIVCDDGLQHYQLPRDIEVALVDGSVGFGNGHLLPAGPLREGIDRLKEVDFVVLNGDLSAANTELKDAQKMRLKIAGWSNLNTAARVQLPQIPMAGKIHAVAGIANPERFFTTLRSLNIEFEEHPFDDHHKFVAEDFAFARDEAVVMTAKDAVKCSSFATDQFWSLDVEAEISPQLLSSIHDKVAALRLEKTGV